MAELQAAATVGFTRAEASGNPTREQVSQFIQNGINMMRDTKTRNLLKDSSIKAPGKKLIDLQRQEWDGLGIDQDLGCSCLNALETLFPGDEEILNLRGQFIQTAQRTFLLALEDRQPKNLERKKPMPRDTVMEFFDACNTRMDLPETHERLVKHMQKTKQLPNQVIINIQRDLLEVLGFERDHGCAMLSRIGQDFPDDKEMHMRFQGWQKKAEATCRKCAILHKEHGGKLDASPEFEKSLMMLKMQENAQKEVQKMSPKEQEELLARMRKKVEIFTKLPQEGRQSYIDKLSESDRMEFGKAQILLFETLRQEQQKAGAASSAGGSARCSKEASVMAPGQQQMM